MNVLVYYIIFFFVTKNILIIRSQEAASVTSDQKGLGVSSCNYNYKGKQMCGHETVAADKSPDTCTSFVYSSFEVDTNYDVYQIIYEDDILEEICNVGKNVYVLYGRKYYAHWSLVLAGMACGDTNAVDESKGIKAFLKIHPRITGLLIYGLEPNPDSDELVGITENLIKYIETLKRETGLEIGLAFSGYYFFLYCQNPKSPWLDIPVLDKVVDFYYFGLTNFYNECTNDMTNGPYSIDGNAPYTLEKLKKCIDELQIPKEKTHFSSVLAPRPVEGSDGNICTINSETLCTSPNITSECCADTIETFFKKGQWYKQNGAGFCAVDINYDDPLGCCNCGPYPAYNAILAGFNGSPTAPTCCLFDQQA